MDRIKNDLILKEIMLRIGKLIKEEREKRGWDYTDVVIRSGLSYSVVYTLELGIPNNITIKSLIGLSAAFDTDIISLLQSPPTA